MATDEKKKKKDAGCTSCKKKNKVTELQPLVDELYFPTITEIKEAYFNLINMKGVKETDKPQIDKVFKSLFDEDFLWKCNTCVTSQVIRFTNYMRFTLKAIPQ